MTSPARSFSFFILASVCLSTTGVAQSQPADTSGAALALLQSRAATKELLSSLRMTLERQLAAGGPVRAVDVCADTAQILSEAVATKTGVTIRRVSDRWRNPLDRPDAFEHATLSRFADALRDSTLTEAAEYSQVVIENGSRVFRYLKPIRIQGMCTACHGDPSRMEAGVKKVISERYPDDRATGYQTGDLRGAVSARVRLPEPRNR